MLASYKYMYIIRYSQYFSFRSGSARNGSPSGVGPSSVRGRFQTIFGKINVIMTLGGSGP